MEVGRMKGIRDGIAGKGMWFWRVGIVNSGCVNVGGCGRRLVVDFIKGGLW